MKAIVVRTLLLIAMCGTSTAAAALTPLTDLAGRPAGWAVELPMQNGVALVLPDGSTLTEVIIQRNPFSGDPLGRARDLLPQASVLQANYIYPATGNYLLAARVAIADGTDSWVFIDLLTLETLSTGVPTAYRPVAAGTPPNQPAVRRAVAALLARPLTVVTPFPVHSIFRSTHATAAISLLEFWGLRPPAEPFQVFAGTLTSFTTRCLCDDPRKPIVWELQRGMLGLAGYRRQPLAVEEMALIGSGAPVFSFADYRWQIDNRMPVLLTFAYGEDNRRPAWLAYRLNARTVVGIGYLAGDESYIVAAGTVSGELSLLRWDNTMKLITTVRHEEHESPGVVRTMLLGSSTDTVAVTVTVSETGTVAAETTSIVVPVRAKELHYFFDATCHDCLRTDDYLRRLLAEDTGIVLHKYNLKNPENVGLLLQYYRAYRIPAQEWQGTLILFAGRHCYRDYDEIERGLAIALRTASPEDTAPLVLSAMDTALPREVFAAFSAVSIALAGLADGINPCAFGVMLFFFTCLRMLGRRRREVALVGMSFAAGVYVAYLLIGIGALQAIYQMTELRWLARWMYPVMAVLSMLLAVYSLLDWQRARRGEWQDMTLVLPAGMRDYIHKFIREHLKVRVMVPTAFAIGLAVSVLELACTGQIYLPVLMYIAGDPNLRFNALLWLLLYVTMFIVPLLLLFAFVYWGSSTVALTGFSRRLNIWAKAVLALVFAALAGYIWQIALQLF